MYKSNGDYFAVPISVDLKSDETKKNASYLQLPGLWTEGPYSQGERQDRDRMSEMPHEIRKEELKCSDM